MRVAPHGVTFPPTLPVGSISDGARSREQRTAGPLVGRSRPALGIGGDYYDFVQLRNGKLGIAIGDISGKGVAAALLTSNLQASLRGQTLAEVSDLSALMRNINQMML
jgi:serine phosphatase RsbU (regulator of sigma subunit)